jgi:hypothetical protein
LEKVPDKKTLDMVGKAGILSAGDIKLDIPYDRHQLSEAFRLLTPTGARLIPLAPPAMWDRTDPVRR